MANFILTQLKKETSTIMSVDPSVFAELIGMSSTEMIFKLIFKISTNNPNKKIEDYDRVKIFVKDKQSTVSLTSTLTNPVVKNLQISQVAPSNSTISASPTRNLTLSNSVIGSGLSFQAPSLPINSVLTTATRTPFNTGNLQRDLSIVTAPTNPALEQKKNTKKDLVSGLTRPPDYYNSVQVNLVPYIANLVGVDFTYSKLELRQKSSQTVKSTSLTVDPKRLIPQINESLTNLSEPVSEAIDTSNNLENEQTKREFLLRGKSEFYYNLLKYFLLNVQASPKENVFNFYDVRKVTETVNDIQIEEKISIPRKDIDNFSIVFELFKKKSNVPDEKIAVDLSVGSHVQAFKAITSPPSVGISSSVRLVGNPFVENEKICAISARDPKDLIRSYNIYLKDISDIGIVTNFTKIGNVKKSQTTTYKFVTSSKLSVLRVIPVDKEGKESNVFTDVTVGPGHNIAFNSALTATLRNDNAGVVYVTIKNIPRETKSVTLYRRDCLLPADPFVLIGTLNINGEGLEFTMPDKSAASNGVYEYCVVCTCRIKQKEFKIYSNQIIFKNTPSASSLATVNVENFNTSENNGRISNSFEISTIVTQQENERITTLLKTAIPELYDYFVNPTNNSSSPLGKIDSYADLFIHEIVRLNLKTAEREVFDLVPDGLFVDNDSTQKRKGLKPINPDHQYEYHVYSFMKNPVYSFKRFILKGKTIQGKEWFYLPYKWLNPSAKNGTLYADDNEGIPIINTYDFFTSEPLGLKKTIFADKRSAISNIRYPSAKRIDVNSVMIGWTRSDSLSYDSFAVMKVVNGIRSFVGRTCKDFIYHELTEEDLGTIYYIIVPIMSDMSINSPVYTDSIFIGTEGLSKRVKSVKRAKVI